MNSDDLNRCVRSELSAIEIYRQALDKLREQHASDPGFQQLAGILREHEEAAHRVRELVRQHGGSPSSDSGAWGAWSKTVMGAAKLMGDKAALKALKEGEQSGLKEYEAVSQDQSTAADVKSVLQELMTRQRQHIQTLDALIDRA